MGIFRQFPYTNFHELNLDEIIKIMREMQDEWAETKTEWASYKDFIDNYFENLDVSAEVLAILQKWALDGTFIAVTGPTIADEVSDWLADNIGPTTPAIDASLTVAGAGADAEVTGYYIEKARENEAILFHRSVTPYETLITRKDIYDGGFSLTGLDDDTTDPAHDYRARTPYFEVEPDTEYVVMVEKSVVDLDFSVSFYTTNDYKTARTSATAWTNLQFASMASFRTPSNEGTKYARIIFRHHTDPSTSPLDASYFDFNIYINHSNNNFNNIFPVVLGGGYAHNGNLNENTTNTFVTPMLNNGFVQMTPRSYAYALFYDSNGYMGKLRPDHTLDKVAGNWGRLYTFIDVKQLLSDFSADYVKFIFGSDIAGAITALTYKEFAANNINFVTNYAQEYYNNATSDNYAVTSNGLKMPVRLIPLGGLISGAQSFCAYNNLWYSTDGTNLYEQDADFVLQNTYTTLTLGHGNGLQLGANNKFYCSGWDDNNVYVIDPTDMSESVIALPVSGYTTCAVDTLNGLMYIFYRNSYPDTVTNYEFIVWDYINNNIISRKYINAFMAMQAADFVDGKIFVTYGISPNDTGVFIYNTNGDLIGEIKSKVLSATEPEGIYVDRNNKNIFVTDVNRNIYIVY